MESVKNILTKKICKKSLRCKISYILKKLHQMQPTLMLVALIDLQKVVLDD